MNYLLRFPNQRYTFMSALLWLILGVALFQPTPVAAAGAVGNGAPASCTEAALDAALADGGTVTFNCGAAMHTLVLTKGRTINANTTVDGGDRITLSGGGKTRLFTVSNGGELTLKNLTLIDGAGDTGAVYNAGTFTVERSSWQDHQHGAIYNAGGSVTVRNNIFRNNVNGQGGAIVNENGGELTVTDAIFRENRISGSGSGGAIYNSSQSTATLRNVFFLENQAADGSGGGFYNGGTMTAERVTVEENRAYSGGGIYNGGTLVLRFSHLKSNTATGNFGGGIAHFNQTSSASQLEINNSALDNNVSLQSGGGLFVSGALVSFQATNVTVAHNTATTQGGGGLFVASSNATLTNVTFNANISVATAGNSIENSSTAPGTITLKNTLVVGGSCAGAIGDGGGNLQYPDTSCGATIATANPELGLFGYNGGLTPTYPIGENGPAHNAARNAACPASDQRGVLRPQFDSCDIGAFEWGAKPVLTAIEPTSTLALSPEFTLTVRGENLLAEAPGSRVLWDGQVLATSYLSGTTLSATVPFSLVVEGKTVQITLDTPVVDGAVSATAQPFTVIKRDQTITFAPLSERTPSTPTFIVTATASSGLPVTFSAEGVCNATDDSLSLTGVEGTCTVTAQQAGNASYALAPAVRQTFLVRAMRFLFLPIVKC